ncbi:MAG TPA: hypothetical protein VFW28_03615 [Micropepsaceae bacterium]|nr:hypothetical protein [Micropepsaceae bacterium]
MRILRRILRCRSKQARDNWCEEINIFEERDGWSNEHQVEPGIKKNAR